MTKIVFEIIKRKFFLCIFKQITSEFNLSHIYVNKFYQATYVIYRDISRDILIIWLKLLYKNYRKIERDNKMSKSHLQFAAYAEMRAMHLS